MKENLILPDTAKLAKEKGFKWKTFHNYDYSKNSGKRPHLYYGEEYSLNPRNNNGETWAVRYELSNHNSIKNSTCYSAPTQSLLQKWLREEHNISIKIDDFTHSSKVKFDFSIKILGSQEDNAEGIYNTYEEALEIALQEALKLIKT